MVGPIAYQMLHRFGAYSVTLCIGLLFFMTLFANRKLQLKQSQRSLVFKIFFLLGTQIYVGVMNLKFLMPAGLSVLHLALALSILLALVKFYYSIRGFNPNVA